MMFDTKRPGIVKKSLRHQGIPSVLEKSARLGNREGNNLTVQFGKYHFIKPGLLFIPHLTISFANAQT
jgi:hypothetical protein